MDSFDEDETHTEESYLFNEEGNQLMGDDADVDAEGEEDEEGEGEGGSEDGSDEPRFVLYAFRKLLNRSVAAQRFLGTDWMVGLFASAAQRRMMTDRMVRR